MDFDITVEKETSVALLKREKQLLEAQAIGKIGSFEWDIVNDTSISSPELRNIFETDHRQSLEEMLQKVNPDDVEMVQKALAEAFTSGIYQCEFRYMAPSSEKVIDSKGIVSFDEDRNPLTLTGTLQDITERKKIEESLLKNTIELEHSNTQLQEFAYIASHDLKEPLRKIGMFSNIIMTTDWDLLPERTKNNIQKISDSATRMQKLIESILSYSTINAEQEKVHCSLEEILQEALNNLEYKLQETGAVVLSDGLPDAAVVPFQMQQLFQNLIGNSLKFSRKLIKPEVKVSHSFVAAKEVPIKDLKQAKQYLRIEVADNGIGFDEEAAEKIFGLFQRLHGRSDYEGSGVGLAICKRIVERHGGIITASSKVWEGATFAFFLPVV
jgi:light-regulated signal transduction histidine kinase (bacteriophytochrome)